MFQKGKTRVSRIIALCLTAVLLAGLMSGCFNMELELERPKVTFPVPSGPSVATQTTAGQAKPDPELLPGLPAGLENNIYLGSRKKGDCKAMVGDVLLTVVFASDSESTWSDVRMKAMESCIWAVEERIEQDAAAWGAELELTVEFKTGTATEGKLALGDNKQWLDSVMQSAGLGPQAEANRKLKESRGVDEAPVAVFVDRSGRSFATVASSETGAEYVVCYEDADALYHELSHVFGAKDFYYPQSVKELAETYLPDSIMVNSGEGIMESLTAYLIGWTDTPSEEALAFLQATAGLTKEQIDEEREREQYTGYVTDFQKGDAVYTGYLVDGQLHGYGTRTSANGDSYTGDWDHGVKHGNGTFTWASGDSYTGGWNKGLRHGTGTYTWADGASYTGDWVEGKRTGQGKMVSKDGAIYEGSYLDGKRHGTGSQIMASGDRYEGQWSQDVRHGTGTYTWADGASYTGDWLDGKRTGKGTWRAADGGVYEGDFVNGDFHGQGTYTFASGDSYTGGWANSKREGYGVYQWTNGTKYEGQFVNNQRHGQGTMTYSNGQVESGLWENGNFKG